VLRMSRAGGLLLIVAVVLVVAACGSSSKSKPAASPPSPSTPSTTTALSPSAVAQGNAPVKIAFDNSGYLAACEKSLQTPNSQGKAFSHSQAVATCGCMQQQAKAEGLGSKSEASITDKQFSALLTTCTKRATGGGSTGAGTTT